MQTQDLFWQRYDALYSFWLGGVWEMVPFDLMRLRPHPAVNSIAWNLWHLLRVEDAGVNRFVADLPQVFDDGWAAQLNFPWRHNGSGMDFDEVDELDRRLDLEALHSYAGAVTGRTRAVVIAQLDAIDLDATLQEGALRRILFDEGLAHPRSGGLLANYLGWTKGKCLFNFALTHPYQHVGEIGVLASLLGVDFG
jgi:hypothetical protein